MDCNSQNHRLFSGICRICGHSRVKYPETGDGLTGWEQGLLNSKVCWMHMWRLIRRSDSSL